MRILDRERIEAVLKRRFPGAAPREMAAAVNAIVGMDEEWEELSSNALEGVGEPWVPCHGSCLLLDAAAGGARFRVFKRVAS